MASTMASRYFTLLAGATTAHSLSRQS